MSFSTCTAHLRSSLTHGTRRWFGFRTRDCLGWAGQWPDVIGLHWRRTGILTLFSQAAHSLKLTPMTIVLRAILARLPGRQYQRDASKHRCSCPPIPFRSMKEGGGPSTSGCEVEAGETFSLADPGQVRLLKFTCSL